MLLWKTIFSVFKTIYEPNQKVNEIILWSQNLTNVNARSYINHCISSIYYPAHLQTSIWWNRKLYKNTVCRIKLNLCRFSTFFECVPLAYYFYASLEVPVELLFNSKALKRAAILALNMNFNSCYTDIVYDFSVLLSDVLIFGVNNIKKKFFFNHFFEYPDYCKQIWFNCSTQLSLS